MEKSREEIRNKIIRDYRENMKNWDEAKRALESDPVWQEMQKWVIIDWNDGREKILESGVSVMDGTVKSYAQISLQTPAE